MLKRVDQRELSPADIAASVQRTRKHEAAEQQLRELRDLRAAVRAEMLELIARRRNESEEVGLTKRIGTLQSRIAELDTEIGKVRVALKPLREAHGASVAVALEPATRHAAGRLVAAIAELNSAAESLGGLLATIASAGGPMEQLPVPHLTLLEQTARRLAGLRELGTE